MAFGNGTKARLYFQDGSDTAIGHEVDCTVSLSAETRSTVTKDTGGGGWSAAEGGTKSASFSGNFVYEEDTTYGEELSDVYDKWEAGAAVTIVFSLGDTTGQMVLTCSAVITSVEISAAAEENVTFSFTAESTGAITKTAVA